MVVFSQPWWLWCLLWGCGPSLGLEALLQPAKPSLQCWQQIAFLGFTVCCTDLLVVIFLQMLFVSRRSPVPSGVLQFDVMWYSVLITKRSWKLMLNSNQWSWQLWLGCVCQCFNWSWDHASESTKTCRCGTQGHGLVVDLVRLNGLWGLFQTW